MPDPHAAGPGRPRRPFRVLLLLAAGVSLAVVAALASRRATPPATSTLAVVNGTPAQSTGPTLRLRMDGAAHEALLELGPIDLPAGWSHHQVRQPRAQEVAFPGAGWLHGYSVELVDRDGRPVPHAVLHHLNLIEPTQRELFSPIMLRVGAMGSETSPVHLPRLLGYPVRQGDSLLVTAMFHNPTSASYAGVTLRVHLEFTPASTWLPPFSFHPIYMDVMPPAGTHAYDLPSGRSSRSWEARPALSGRILGLGGHLHRYATLLRLEDVTAGKVLWESRPILDAARDVVGMPQTMLYWRGGIRIDAEHLYRLTAFYNNPTGRMIPEGAMGALGGAFIPARGAAWPAIDRHDPEYLRDVQVTWAGMREMSGMGDMGGRSGMSRGGASGGTSGNREPPPGH